MTQSMALANLLESCFIDRTKALKSKIILDVEDKGEYMNSNTFEILSFLLLSLTTYTKAVIIGPQKIKVGQEFKISLPTARSTTYDWYFKEISKQISPAGLLVPSEPAWATPYGTPTYSIPAQGSPLKNEIKIFTFKALHPGTIVLLFQKKHRYKTGKKVIDTKEVKVTIQEK
jgi:hypothetical protein